MYRIEKQFAFEAAHWLDGLPEGHPCGRVHGHSYRVVVALDAEATDARGFVRDFGELRVIGGWIAEHWDHRTLNDLFRQHLAPRIPSAEHLARFLFERFKPHFPELVEVRVSETQKTWASYWESPRGGTP